MAKMRHKSVRCVVKEGIWWTWPSGLGSERFPLLSPSLPAARKVDCPLSAACAEPPCIRRLDSCFGQQLLHDL